MLHQCIKTGCLIKYESEDEDPYYCPEHLAEKKVIAKEIDKRIGARLKDKPPPISGIAHYDSLPQIKGFVRAKDLGL